MGPVGQFLLVLFIFVHTVVSEETDHNEFFVVSTSQRPSEVQTVADPELQDLLKRFHKEIVNNSIKLVDLKKSLEQQLEDARKEIKELKNSKESMEGQMEKAEKEISELKDLKVSLETQIQSRISENEHKFEETKIKIAKLASNSQLQAKQLQEQSDHLEIFFKELQNTQKLIEYNLPKDCKEVRKTGFRSSGVYRIKPESSLKSFKVWCDMETRGGGWIYLLNRFNGSVDFHLNWTDYKQGFGNPSGELWLGLENLYQLTGIDNQAKELLIELVKWEEEKVHAYFKDFRIGNEEEGYYLKSLGEYSGNAGNYFLRHVGSKFSTEDRDQDVWSGNCAKEWGASWWHDHCFWWVLTGNYETNIQRDENGICYSQTPAKIFRCVKEAKMMIR